MKIQTTINAPVDNKGRAVTLDAQSNARDGGESALYAPIAPATYDAVVTKAELAEYRARSSGNINPNSTDGLWDYLKIVPEITVLNDVGTKISRQDFTIGVRDGNGEFIRPDNKPESPIWKQGQYLLTALGCFSVNESNPLDFDLMLNDELIFDRVIRVKTGLAAYIKEPKVALDVAKLVALLAAINGGSDKYSFDAVSSLVNTFNGLDAEQIAKLPHMNLPLAQQIVANRADGGDGLLKIKTVVQSVYAITPERAQEKGWYYDPTSGAVYTTTAAWARFKELELIQDLPPKPF